MKINDFHLIFLLVFIYYTVYISIFYPISSADVKNKKINYAMTFLNLCHALMRSMSKSHFSTIVPGC